MYKQSFKRTRASLSIGKNGCVVTPHDVLDGTLPNDAARKKVEDKDTNKNELVTWAYVLLLSHFNRAWKAGKTTQPRPPK